MACDCCRLCYNAIKCLWLYFLFIITKDIIIWFRPELNNLSYIRNEVTQFSFAASSALRVNPASGSNPASTMHGHEPPFPATVEPLHNGHLGDRVKIGHCGDVAVMGK